MGKVKSKPDLHTRYRDYLAKFKIGEDIDAFKESTWIATGKLKSLALTNGYRLNEIRRAIEALKDDVDIACVWDRETRTERFCFILMTDKERKARLADREWFDNLK